MHRPNTSRVGIVTLAAMAAFAATTGLGGQADLRLREGTTYGDFHRAAKRRVARAGGWVGGAHPKRPNGGKRRKSAIRARRMNNSGNGNQWSRKHA